MSDPERARAILALGESLVVFAGRGELRKLKETVERTPEGDVMVYFIAKMFQESLLNGHLMVASYIIEQGYPFNSSSVPNVLHQCLQHPEIEDYRAAELCEFLRLKGIDIDAQAPKNWLTALHMAVQRSFVTTVRTLVDNGADVNAVADDDLLPLTIAERCTPSPDMEEIKALLRSKGARTTWRSAIVVPPSPKSGSPPSNKLGVVGDSSTGASDTVFNDHMSTMVSFSGGFRAGGLGVPTVIIAGPSTRPVATVTVDTYLPAQDLKASFAGEMVSGGGGVRGHFGDGDAEPKEPAVSTSVRPPSQNTFSTTTTSGKTTTSNHSSTGKAEKGISIDSPLPLPNQKYSTKTDDDDVVFIGVSDDGGANLFSTGGGYAPY